LGDEHYACGRIVGREVARPGIARIPRRPYYLAFAQRLRNTWVVMAHDILQTAASIFVLTSGQVLHVTGIVLYPADVLATVANLRNLAAEKLGGVSAGIGFIGSPGWVLGASAALGIIEGMMSSSARKDGVRLLGEADAKANELLDQGLIVPVDQISNRHRPSPASWSALCSTDESVNLYNYSRKQRANFLATHKRTEADVKGHNVTILKKKPFIHNGDDFLQVETEQFGLIHVRWSAVQSYTSL
jgi:hypothetical protein